MSGAAVNVILSHHTVRTPKPEPHQPSQLLRPSYTSSANKGNPLHLLSCCEDGNRRRQVTAEVGGSTAEQRADDGSGIAVVAEGSQFHRLVVDRETGRPFCSAVGEVTFLSIATCSLCFAAFDRPELRAVRASCRCR